MTEPVTVTDANGEFLFAVVAISSDEIRLALSNDVCLFDGEGAPGGRTDADFTLSEARRLRDALDVAIRDASA